jgi:transposase-like protein
MRQLAIGNGSLGFWAASHEEYGQVAQQRCWVHKTANILDKMPKKKSCCRSSGNKQSYDTREETTKVRSLVSVLGFAIGFPLPNKRTRPIHNYARRFDAIDK